MITLAQMASDLKTRPATFQTVRISAVQTSEQMLQEIKAISPDKLPAAIIVFEGGIFTDCNTIEDATFSIVAVDKFKAASDDKATSVLGQLDALLTLFPPEGVTLNNVFYTPTDLLTASADSTFACLGLRLAAKQGI